ncbi:phosphopentomutase [Candidatus Parcubacteria bacterium]|jgi:phosphopentomutase|nr:MAG: phosphopentomutase [Candidatus Parcubacteria bacterium]
MKRQAVTIVLDGVGAGELPDAGRYGDRGASSLSNTARAVGGLRLPALQALGLGGVAPIRGVEPAARPAASFGRMAALSPGKDSTTGHWELMGCALREPFPVYPDGFPPEIIAAFERRVGRAVLGNRAASGTEIIEELGEEHLRTGRPIVYTSADSVFQIAAHESAVPVRELYRMCRTARSVLVPPHHVARVIARPFTGSPGAFVRTKRRRDFSLPPPGPTLLDDLAEAGGRVVTVGKIHDLFARRGIARIVRAGGNEAAMRGADRVLREGDPFSLLFVNLVDFDMIWGHRRDPGSFARGLERFDGWLARFMALLPRGALLAVTSDHGCDPTMPGSDHTREYSPILAAIAGSGRAGVPLGARETLSDLAATLAEWFGLPPLAGKSFLAALE